MSDTEIDHISRGEVEITIWVPADGVSKVEELVKVLCVRSARKRAVKPKPVRKPSSTAKAEARDVAEGLPPRGSPEWVRLSASAVVLWQSGLGIGMKTIGKSFDISPRAASRLVDYGYLPFRGLCSGKPDGYSPSIDDVIKAIERYLAR